MVVATISGRLQERAELVSCHTRVSVVSSSFDKEC